MSKLIIQNTERTITNPITDSSLAIREVINKLFKGSQLECLDALYEQPLCAVDLADQLSVSRPTADGYCGVFVDRGWIKRSNEDGAYTLTAAGAIVRREAKDSLEALPQSDLTWLSASSSKPRVLAVLHEDSMTSAVLADRIDDISRSRVSQLRGEFENRGWISKTRGELQLTSSGREALETYSHLLDVVEQVLANAPGLRDLGPECEGLPVTRLDSARQVIARPGRNPLATVNEYLKLAERDFDRLRAFSSFYDTRHARAYHPAVKDGKKMETISPEWALDEMPIDTQEDIKYVVEGLAAENVSWQIYPGELPLGLAIFDDGLVVIGAKNVSEASTDMAANIHSTDEEVIQWAVDLYDDYCEASYTPPVERIASYIQLPAVADALGGIRTTVYSKIIAD